MRNAIHLCSFSDPGDYRIAVGGRERLFEFSEMFGPLLVGKRGEPLATQPQSGPVLEAISYWAQQGKRVENGRCVWTAPPKPKLVHLGGRHWAEVPASGKLSPSLAAAACPGCPRCEKTRREESKS